MEWVHLLRWAHIIGACVLLGTGAGIAFFMVMAQRVKDARVIAHVAGTVVIADWLFTAAAVVLQPITGALLAMEIGWRMSEGWIVLSLALYVLVGLLWLPVVWIQLQLRDMARAALTNGTSLAPHYHQLYRWWLILGSLAFPAIVVVFYLMVFKPECPL